jgi:uncharacterized membrane protein
VGPFVALHGLLHTRLAASERGWEKVLARVYLYTPALLLTVLVRFELGRISTVVGWAILAFILLYLGIRYRSADLRWQSYLLAGMTFVRSWTTNFYGVESLGGVPLRIVIALAVIVAFFAAELLARRLASDGQGQAGHSGLGFLTVMDRHSRTGFSLLGTVLLAALLYHEVSGSYLTVAWGLQGSILLAAGFLMSERSMRLSGLALLMLCILKLFLFDLNQLDTPYRILSFTILGFLSIGVSWIYTRYRQRLGRYW